MLIFEFMMCHILTNGVSIPIEETKEICCCLVCNTYIHKWLGIFLESHILILTSN